jgi:hypothetical protein
MLKNYCTGNSFAINFSMMLDFMRLLSAVSFRPERENVH